MAQFPEDLLFDFDKTSLKAWDQAEAEKRLHDHPAIYRNHLAIAWHLDLQASRLEQLAETLYRGDIECRAHSLREVAAGLRYGEYLPGSSRFDDWIERE